MLVPNVENQLDYNIQAILSRCYGHTVECNFQHRHNVVTTLPEQRVNIEADQCTMSYQH